MAAVAPDLQGLVAGGPSRSLREVSSLREAAALFATCRGPQLMAAAAAVAFGARVWAGTALTVVEPAVCAAVVLLWWFQEWAAHVYLLHLKPAKVLGVRLDPLFARVHRAHHREPWDLKWVLVPVRFVALGFVVSAGVFWLALPPAIAATALFAYCVMGVLYEWSHFLVHTRHKPRSKFFRAIWRNHRLHHFMNENHWYGLSSTLVDGWLGTNPEPEDVAKSSSARTLGVTGETE